MIVQFLLASVVIGFISCSDENVTLRWPTDKQPCIMIQSVTNNTLTWNNSGNIFNIGSWSLGESTVINGSCDEPVFLEFRFNQDNATFQFVFIKEKNNKVTVNMSLEFVPKTVFGKDGNNDTDPIIIGTSMPTGTVDHSYVCDQERGYEVKVDAYILNLRFTYLKLQGFGMKDGKWSEEESCASTNTTTAATTTATAATTTATAATTTATTAKPPNPEQHDLLRYNTSCVLLDSEMQWSIPYIDINGTSKIAKIGIQSSIRSSFNATCNESAFEDVLSISLFNDTWDMSITFGGDSSKFWWKHLSLIYVLNETLFPGINQTEVGKVRSVSHSDHLFEAPMGGSFKCSSTNTDFGNDTSFSTWNLQYTALQKNVTEFSKSVTPCSNDVKTNTIVPIAVGAALAGLVVIVLIAYLIGRRRNRKGYESV